MESACFGHGSEVVEEMGSVDNKRATIAHKAPQCSSNKVDFLQNRSYHQQDPGLAKKGMIWMK